MTAESTTPVAGRPGHRTASRIAIPVALALWGCSGSPAAQPMAPGTVMDGSIRVEVSTQGVNEDVDGYVAVLDGTDSVAVGSNGVAVFSPVRSGIHLIELSAMSLNCTSDETNPSTRQVSGGATTVRFTVRCGHLIYATARDPDRLIVIESIRHSIVKSFPLVGRGWGVGVSRDGGHVYAVGAVEVGREVTVIETSGHTVAETIAVGAIPFLVGVDPGGHRAYVLETGSDTRPGEVEILDGIRGEKVNTIRLAWRAWGIAVHPNGDRVYVAEADRLGFQPHHVVVIDALRGIVSSRIPTGVQPRGLALNGDGSRLYVANERSEDVQVIDTSTESVIASLPVGSRDAVDGPEFIAVNADGSRIFVSKDRWSEVVAIDGNTGSVLASLFVPAPGQLQFTPDHSRLYVASPASLSIIDPASLSVLETVPLGRLSRFFGIR